MNKINAFLEKNVGDIAIGLGITGIVVHCLVVLLKYPKLGTLFSIVNFYDPFKSVLVGTSVFDKINLLSILFLIMLTVGGNHHKKSEGEDTRLLKFGFSIIAITNLLYIISNLLAYISFERHKNTVPDYLNEAPSVMGLFYPLLVMIPLCYVGFYLTKWLVRQQNLDYVIENSDDERTTYSYDLVPRLKRFTHLVFDMFLMFLIILPFALSLIVFIEGNLSFLRDAHWTDDRLGLSLFVGLMIVFYYLIFEGLFFATPVKFITGVSVINAKNMEAPKIGKILLRTLCRRIPFDSLSYFGREGWHDTFSGTDVIFEKKEGQVRFRHGIWIVLLLGTYLASGAIVLITKKIDKKRHADLRETVRLDQKNAKLENLNAGDLLIFRRQKGLRNDGQTIVVVDKVSNKEVSGIQYILGFTKKMNRAKFHQEGITGDWKIKGPISIDRSQLADAVINNSMQEAFNLVGGTPYFLADIEDVDNPVFTISTSKRQKNDGFLENSYFVNYDACNIEILSIQPLEGTSKCTMDFPFRTTYDSNKSTGHFRIELEERKDKEFSKFRMKISCDGRELDYIIFKYESTLKFVKEG